MKNLVIVESPSKSKTIEKYLGSDYKVLSSKGHVRDLATTGKKGYGIDVDNDFEPNYITIKGKQKLINELKKEAKPADNVILATDPDREGEAISWHLKEVLGDKNNYQRVTFNEITKDAVIEAMKHPRDIDMDLVQSQETRRFLDRIIGFDLSKEVKKYTNGGESAGRVQSVVLKLICDREREIEAFVQEEYYTIETDFKDFKAELKKYRGKDIKISTSVEADEIINTLSNAYNIEKVEKKPKNKQSKLPFTTSTLTQMASNRLGYPASKTMSIAQKLYEGIDIGSETVGLISYMRTDSVRLSDVFINETKTYIANNYGKEYIGYAKTGKKKDNVQDAHEAIRPTSINRTPESIKKYLSPEEYKLYNLIYIRTLASLMADAKTEVTSVDLENKEYIFKASGQVCLFDGYLKVYGEFEESKDETLPDLEKYKSKVLISDDVKKIQHFTKPEPRYTEASLIKKLEEEGVGRPSTYATVIKINIDREYVIREDKKFVPTALGFEVNDLLAKYFNDVINVKYTSNMETDLDKIAEDKVEKFDVLKTFYFDKWLGLLDNIKNNAPKKTLEETGEMCPLCGSPLVVRKGKYGKFVACSNYPTCKHIKKEEKEVVVVGKCPDCGGNLVERQAKKGKNRGNVFYACSNFPKCKYTTSEKPNEE